MRSLLGDPGIGHLGLGLIKFLLEVMGGRVQLYDFCIPIGQPLAGVRKILPQLVRLVR